MLRFMEYLHKNGKQQISTNHIMPTNLETNTMADKVEEDNLNTKKITLTEYANYCTVFFISHASNVKGREALFYIYILGI